MRVTYVRASRAAVLGSGSHERLGHPEMGACSIYMYTMLGRRFMTFPTLYYETNQ